LAVVPGAVVFHRNERTLAGLFREGLAHGYHGVQARRRHAAFLDELGHGAGAGRRLLARTGAGLADWARRREPARARCEAAFHAGKATGDLLGTLRDLAEFRPVDARHSHLDHP
jgi:hypothetical protein